MRVIAGVDVMSSVRAAAPATTAPRARPCTLQVAAYPTLGGGVRLRAWRARSARRSCTTARTPGPPSANAPLERWRGLARRRRWTAAGRRSEAAPATAPASPRRRRRAGGDDGLRARPSPPARGDQRRLAEVAGRGEALARLLGHRARTTSSIRAAGRRPLQRRGRRRVDVREHRGPFRRAGERRLAGERLEEQAAERVDVGAARRRGPRGSARAPGTRRARRWIPDASARRAPRRASASPKSLR